MEKKASISSTDIKESNLDKLIERCVDSTKVTPIDEYNSLPDKELHFKGEKNLNLYDKTHLTNEEKINFIKEAEETAFSHDKIVNTNGSGLVRVNQILYLQTQMDLLTDIKPQILLHIVKWCLRAMEAWKETTNIVARDFMKIFLHQNKLVKVLQN